MKDSYNLFKLYTSLFPFQEVLCRPGSTVGCTSDWCSGCRGFDPPVWQHSFMEIGHKIISTAILCLRLIQVGRLSITDERRCTYYGLIAFLGLSLPRKSVDSLTDSLDMTIVVDWDVNIQTDKQRSSTSVDNTYKILWKPLIMYLNEPAHEIMVLII